MTGAFPLTSVGKLPNVDVAFPGERWSDRMASGTIVPGEAVVPISVGGKLYVIRATTAQAGRRQLAIASQPVQPPDPNSGPAAIGPNELVNKALTTGQYVLCYYSGAFNLTLVEPLSTYVPGDLITWVDDAARPADKGGVGAWTKTGATEDNAFFEVSKPYRKVNDDNEGILTVRSLRGQF